MKYFTIICVLIMCSFSQAEQEDRFFKTAHGDINLSSLESILSSAMKVPVTNLNLRKSYDLVKRFTGYYEFGNYREFVVNFVLDSTHMMSCDLTIIKDSNRIMITDCKSATASFYNKIFIDITDVGLPLIHERKHNYSKY